MINKKRIIIYFVILAAALFLYVLISKPKNDLYEYGDENLNKSKVVTLVLKNKHMFETLADNISQNMDTSFYAQYRMKSNKFYFFYFKNDSISNSFTLPDSIEEKVFRAAKNSGIVGVKKYNSENFYRFDLKINDDLNPQILILKHGQSFSIEEGSKIYNSDTLSDISMLDNRKSNSVIFKINSKFWIYFPHEN